MLDSGQPPQLRPGRVLKPLHVRTAQGDPVTILPGMCRIDEYGAVVRVMVGSEDPITLSVNGSDFDRWLSLRELAFLSWR